MVACFGAAVSRSAPLPALRPERATAMKKLFASLALTSLASWSAAQAPVFEPMPEGSHDAFTGLGLAHRASYAGSARRRWQLEPVVQVAWSSGLFVSGTQVGWQLGEAEASGWPRLEGGPLLSLQAPRHRDGQGWFIDSPGAVGTLGNTIGASAVDRGGRLQGMDDVPGRVEWGGFVNLRFSPRWRLTQSLLTSRGREGQGTHASLDLHAALPPLGEHHSLAWSVGAGWSNAAYQRRYFGVTASESARSHNPIYQPGAGVAELHTQLRWNWAWHPQWLLSTSLQASRLQGEAARSPLVERASDTSVSTALVYRY